MITDQCFTCPKCGAPGYVRNSLAEYSCQCRFDVYRPFDMHAPFDAPLRMRTMQREQEMIRWNQFINSPEGKKILEKVVREAMEELGKRRDV